MTVTKPQNATLIDSISEGYAAINRRPWLLLVPILLNLYLWFGAQISIAPLVSGAVSAMKSMQPAAASESDVQEMYRPLLLLGRADMRQNLAVLNVVPMLRTYTLDTESIDDPQSADASSPVSPPPGGTIQIATAGGAVLAFLVINALALALSALFLAQVGAAVRRDWSPTTALRRAGRVCAAILGATAVTAAVALALGLPFMFFATILMFLNQTLGMLAVYLLLMVAFWAGIYIGFTPEAIVVSELGPLRAIHASFNVVRRNFWATIGFLVVSWVISVGSGVIWASLVGSPAGLAVAILGSAYIGSGLLAARMAFFRERLRRWQSAPAPSQGLGARN